MENEYMRIEKLRRAAEDKYLELRDAKSNGCLGFNPPIIKVLAYDNQIMAAHAEMQKYADQQKALLEKGE